MAYTNWKEQGNLFLDFTEELTYEWMRSGFDREQVKEWLDIGMKVEDDGFCAWLRDEVKVDALEVLNYGGEKNLREQHTEYTINFPSKLSEEVIEQIRKFETDRWGIPKLTTEQQTLIDKLIPNQQLKDRYKERGLCQECQQPKIGWCQSCNSKRFQQDFSNWTSGDPTVDEFIQKHQLNATEWWKTLEWIPYEQFTNIEYLAEGGFSKVYKAKWGELKWTGDREVALKSLNNSQNITTDFLQEVSNHKLVDGGFPFHVVQCLGISQDPATKNYVMVMEYMKKGNLRQCLNNNQGSFYEKLSQLLSIANGLNSIHKRGLVHRDFHVGNIILSEWGIASRGSLGCIDCCITDLGLCQPVNEINKGSVYGVLPYVAPEVLRGQSYTQSSDIYSFGIVACEVFLGLPPYHNLVHDEFLGLKVCQGLRPDLDEFEIPKLLKDLIMKCWDTEPLKRPSASELSKILSDWNDEIFSGKNTEFYWQWIETKKTKEEEFREFCKQHNYKYEEDYWRNSKSWEAFRELSLTLYQTHPQAVYTSRLLPTKEITKLLETTEYSQSLAIDFTNLKVEDNQTEQENSDISVKQETHQEIPPKSN